MGTPYSVGALCRKDIHHSSSLPDAGSSWEDCGANSTAPFVTIFARKFAYMQSAVDSHKPVTEHRGRQVLQSECIQSHFTTFTEISFSLGARI